MDAEAYPQEVLADEEPKYLRRQKPLEIKRRKFGKKAWKTYLRVMFAAAVAAGGVGVAYMVGHFLLASQEMALIHPEQIQVSQNHYVMPASVREIFRADRGHSVLRIPLSERRRQIETLPWVEQASVLRALPNTIKVEITERTPIAFLRDGSDLALVDVHGVILDRPLKGNFHFPVVTGISSEMPVEDREQRMQMFASFAQQVEAARGGSMDLVSEVDLTEAKDLRATITGLQGASAGGGAKGDASGGGQWSNADAPILIHFGDSDFENKFLTVLNDIGQWRAGAGSVDSVDLRFSGEAVVNPDPTLVAKESAAPLAMAAPPNAPTAVKSKPAETAHATSRAASHVTSHSAPRASSHASPHASSHASEHPARHPAARSTKKNAPKHTSAAAQQ
ncbi:MAG: FtsQ-type POTRA domain-containing protein [Candidatus Acidiferrales bacterium]